MKRFDAYEIHGCHRLNDAGQPDPNGDSVETCADSQAMFWTLYGHIPGEGPMAIGDCISREAAEEVACCITGGSDRLLPDRREFRETGAISPLRKAALPPPRQPF